MKLQIIITLLILSPVVSAVNKCVDADGKVSYQDKACPINTSSEIIRFKAQTDSSPKQSPLSPVNTSNKNSSSVGSAIPLLSLTVDKTMIRYIDSPPRAGTPQAAMINLVLLREIGNFEDAGKLISKKAPGWLREGMLKPNDKKYGPMKKETLAYQLERFEDNKARVYISYNLKDGTFKGWSRFIVIEEGHWVVR